MFKLLNVSKNAKTVKGDKEGYLTGILYIYPNKKTCPFAEMAGCSAWKHGECLVNAGHAIMFKNINEARQRKTDMFMSDPQYFLELLYHDIGKLIGKAKKQDMIPVVRLNGTSDIMWENYKLDKFGKTLFELFPHVQFYDYTKIASRLNHGIPNYDLTFSYSKSIEFEPEVNKAIYFKSRMAVVFRKSLPDTFMGKRVIDGDKNDLRFLEPNDVIVGLIAKGKARKEESVFVVN